MMWHEARKQERKIRGIMVDYKKRAERRRDFYEKITAEDGEIEVRISLGMPWQGHQDILVDRFDVRAHLDYIPENVTLEQASNETLSREDRLTNYERYRIIVQNDFLGVAEEKFLHQLYLEEQFGPVPRPNEDKKKRATDKAAIPYTYEDTPTPITEPEEVVEGEEIKEPQEEEDDDSDIDFDLCVDVSLVNPQQAHELNTCGADYGMTGTDFFSFLTRDV
ncbi:unnamed protein product [Timema podura]|nr:unnamed protein product [Timema podura]